MGKHKASENVNDIERNRKVPRTFSIPRYIDEELDNCKNPSEIVSMILAENSHRIGNMTLNDAARAREQAIKKSMEKVFDELIVTWERRIREVTKSSLEAYSLRLKEVK